MTVSQEQSLESPGRAPCELIPVRCGLSAAVGTERVWWAAACRAVDLRAGFPPDAKGASLCPAHGSLACYLLQKES